MSIRSLSDIAYAFNNGQFHVQPFYKASTSVVNDGRWIDWSAATGRPIYDSRVGTAGAFYQTSSVGNRGIWFPSITAGMERRLTMVEMMAPSGNLSQVSQNFMLYDLLGYYSQIDGDSTDLLTFDNTQTIQRYTTGLGVRVALVNHLAPSAVAGAATINYINDQGLAKTTTATVSAAPGLGVNALYSGTSATLGFGQYSLSLASGCRGVRSITDFQWTTPPSGFWSLYVFKPITFLNKWHDPYQAQTTTTFTAQLNEKDLGMQCAWCHARIYDGANLHFFSNTFTNSRGIGTYNGALTFVWN